VAQAQHTVLLICADREAAGRLASVIQSAERHIVAAPWGDVARERASGAQLIVIDRVEDNVTATGDGHSAQKSVVTHVRETPEFASVPILCIAASDDVDERVGLLEAGADDVVARPFHPDELRARIEGLLAMSPAATGANAAAASAPIARESTRVISFYAPKGGVGTTMLSVNAAVAAARSGHTVALVDLDLEWGQVATHLNLVPNFSVVELARDTNALNDPEQVRSYGERHPSGVTLFAAPQRPDQAMLIDQSHVAQLLDGLRGAYDRIIVDAGSGFGEQTLAVIEGSDRAVLLMVPEIPAVRSMRTLLELLNELGAPPERQFLLLNHVFENDMLRREDIERSVTATIQAELRYDGISYVRAINEGTPLLTTNVPSPAAKQLEGVLGAILEEAVSNVDEPNATNRFRLPRLALRAPAKSRP
jgi:pilus assembly protein CpaE